MDRKYILIGAIIILMLNITEIIYGQAQPNITITPEHPSPGSTVAFTVEIEDENISEVWIEIQECNGDKGICYPKQNLSMEETSSGVYKGTVSLQHNDATYIQYTLKIKTTVGWSEYFKEAKVTLSTGGVSNDGSTGKDSPGFEFLLVITALLVLFYRRRL